MPIVNSPAGVRIGVRPGGHGEPLVLVHGSFSNAHDNWAFVAPLLAPHAGLHAVDRRGRGASDATEGHGLGDEADDIAAVIRSIGRPVHLLGHSYGALVALEAAARVPDRVRRLALYEPPWPHLMGPATVQALEARQRDQGWSAFAETFFREVLAMPHDELQALVGSPLWAPIVEASPATLGDLRALARYTFDARRFAALTMPVLLQVGSESPRDFYVTDALAAVLPDARVEVLPGQAHEAMMTAPQAYAASVLGFLRPPGARAARERSATIRVA